MQQETLYSGKMDLETYQQVAEEVNGFPTEWIDTDVDLILSGDELKVEGSETTSLLGGTHHPTDTYEVDGATAEYLRQTFS